MPRSRATAPMRSFDSNLFLKKKHALHCSYIINLWDSVNAMASSQEDHFFWFNEKHAAPALPGTGHVSRKTFDIHI